MTPTPTSGAAGLPKALRLAAAISNLLCSNEAAARTLAAAADELVRLHAESEMRRAALLDEMQKAALAAWQATAAKAVVPSGWNLVPTEPTQAMLDAVVTSMDDFLLGKEAEKQYREDWAAMLAAAPAQPVAEPSRFGSPELQAMIIARCMEKDRADSVPAVSDLPPLPAPDLRDVGTKPQEIKEFLKGYATEYARTAIAARAPADSVQEDAAGRATAAQPGVVYAELPVPNYPKSGGFPGTFAEAQMHAFADATHALRASHWQAPAQPDPAYSAACHLATALFKKYFAHLPDFASGQAVWGLCGSTAGVISQIDNMVSGLVQPPTTAPHADSVLEDAARWQALPAFFEEYQIDAMKLYRDIDAYLAAARKQGANHD